jgi:hypothetical protein
MSAAKETEQAEFYPLATNILKLQYYSSFFDLTEIVMFDWFVVKAKAFKYLQFYYSRRRISEEVRIKEDRLITIIKRFAELGIIEIEVKGMPKQHHFIIDFERIIALIPQIFQCTENSNLAPENSKVSAFFSRLLSENSSQKKYNKKDNKETIEEELRKEKNMIGVVTPMGVSSFSDEDNIPIDPQKQKALEAAERKAQREAEAQAKSKAMEIERLKGLLNRIYAQRVQMHNEGIKKGESVKTISKLSFLKRNEEALYELRQQYGNEEIENSFIAYVDQVLGEHIDVGKLVPYFLSRKPQTKDFDTFHTYLNYFIAHYSRVK